MQRKNLAQRGLIVSWGGIITKLSNLLLALMYGVFLYKFMRDFLEHWRFSSLLFVIVESLFVYMSIIRRPPVERSTFGPTWLFTYVGTFAPLFLYPSVSVNSVAGDVIQVVGSLLIGSSIVSLGRSFGMVAANRGIVTSGIYRWVRHPLYMAYFVNATGVLINNMSLYNAVIMFCWAVSQMARIHYEERLLRKNRVYSEYADRVRWRLIPYIY